ncbi:MAG: glycine cleavage system aminomethyltransferase GcvT [Candidatus Omnitrophica bacterium]|nr:glycine cleavage system aminomethyltransferase GcvT [Candidatus Omnitrophota bacterium]
MTDSAMKIRQLPLHEKHAAKGARFGAFGDWEVPLYYTSVIEEHHGVRQKAGLFDISHMGEFWIEGGEVVSFLEKLLPRRIGAMTIGQALYMPLLNDAGGFVDDIILYRFAQKEFLFIVNASNIEKDFNWIKFYLPASGVVFTDQSEEKGLLALQGPESIKILEEAYGKSFSSLAYYHFAPWQSGMIARTGYTGEDGFEIMVDKKDLPEIWEALFAAGAKHGLVPAGFGARDTLRLEAGMLLYGHDMNDETSPLEAGISWAVDMTKDFFIGKEALERQKKQGLKRKLVGFEMLNRGIPRQGYEIRKRDRLLGHVGSGSLCPTLGKNLGMAYLPIENCLVNETIEIMIRDKAQKAQVVKLPFYKRKK